MILVTGGSGCGKSSYAENRIQELAKAQGGTIYYLATMQVYGEEGRRKVQRHVELRRGKGMITIEQTRSVADAVSKMQEGKRFVILEDLGNLVANEMFLENGEVIGAEQVADKVIHDVLTLKGNVEDLVLVTNNVFEDGINYEEGTMNYVRALGQVNAALANEADEAVEVVVGIPLRMGQEKK